MKNTGMKTKRGLRLGVLTALLLSFLLVPLAACNADEEGTGGSTPVSSSTGNYVTIEMADDMGSIVIELEPDEAPLTVANFQKLISEGFYDGLIFHRIVPGFVVQSGDPRGDGTGGSAELIKGEFLSNGVENSIIHGRGVVSMARSKDYNSASSQFYIVLSDNNVSHLDGDYAAFGHVISGIEVADKIVENYLMGKTEPATIDTVTLSEDNPVE